MAGVLVAIDVALDGGVHGDDTQSADDLRRIGNLTLTDGEMLLEVVDVIIHFLQSVIGDGEGGAGGILDSAFTHVFHHGILYHLGIYAEYRYVWILS